MHRFTREASLILFIESIIVFPSLGSSNIGAEWNPTGNPIGGGPGYTDSVVIYDFYVSNRTELFAALASADNGDVVYIGDNAIIDLTTDNGVWIPGGVTLASGRGRAIGDSISWGALILTQNTSTETSLLRTQGNSVRITGLRLQGPYSYRCGRSAGTIAPHNTWGIEIWHRYSEVDNCELWGWSHSAVLVNNSDVYIHHNYIHEGQHSGYGVGVMANSGVNIVIEANKFNYTRQNIASPGDTTQSWEARWNMFLEHGATHGFDRHGWPSQYEWGGKDTYIHHNTVRNNWPGLNAVRIRGKPSGQATVDSNWFYYPDSASAILLFNGDTNASVIDNHYGAVPLPGVTSRIPVPVANTDLDSGTVPLFVQFNSAGSYDPDGDIMWYEWDFGDNSPTIRRETANYSFTDIGRYNVELTIHDNHGIPAKTLRPVLVCPTASDSCYLSAWVNDRYHGSSTGYFSKQIYIDDSLIWADDIAGDEGWVHVIANVTGCVVGKDSVTITMKLRCMQNTVSPGVETFWDDVVLFWGGIQNGDMEGTSGWVYCEQNIWFHKQYTNADARSGDQSCEILLYADKSAGAGDYGQISQRVALGDLGISYNNTEVEVCSLACPYPNPAFGRSNITYTLHSASNVNMDIYDVNGRLVQSLVEKRQIPGQYTVFWDGTDKQGCKVPCGVYFCNFTANDFVRTKQIVWLR